MRLDARARDIAHARRPITHTPPPPPGRASYYGASLSCLSEARTDVVAREQQSLPLSHISATGEVVSVES